MIASNTWYSKDFISNQNVTHKCDFNKCISEVLEFFQLYLLYHMATDLKICWPFCNLVAQVFTTGVAKAVVCAILSVG